MDCPQNSEYWIYLGIFTENDEYKVKTLLKAIDLDPTVPIYYYNNKSFIVEYICKMQLDLSLLEKRRLQECICSIE
jgi:hypothetical protein